jgi:hypothetical protein
MTLDSRHKHRKEQTMKTKAAKPAKKSKPAPRIKDMKAKKDPKGGPGNGFDKLGAYGKVNG